MNQINIVGAPTTELEIRRITAKRTGKERSVLDTRIVVPRGGKDDPKDYFPVTFFGTDAETVAKWSGPGKRLAITGRLELQSWGDKDDRKYKTVIIAQQVTIIDWPRKDEDEDGDQDQREPVGVGVGAGDGTLIDTSDFAPAPASNGYSDPEF